MPAQTESPTISIIIPCYNIEQRMDVLREALGSLCLQSHLPNEVIVVDDGSSDTTAKLLSSLLGEATFSKLNARLFVREENGGTSEARNSGIEQATSELIGFLDFDDLYLPQFIERIIAAFLEDQNRRVVLAEAFFLREYGSISRVSPSFPNELTNELSLQDFTAWVLKYNFPMPMGSSIVCHSSIFKEHSALRFDSFLSKRTAEDVLFGYELLTHKLRPYLLKESLVVHRTNYSFLSRGYGAFLHQDELEVFEYSYDKAIKHLLSSIEQKDVHLFSEVTQELDRKKNLFALKRLFLTAQYFKALKLDFAQGGGGKKWLRQMMLRASTYFPLSVLRVVIQLARTPNSTDARNTVKGHIVEIRRDTSKSMI